MTYKPVLPEQMQRLPGGYQWLEFSEDDGPFFTLRIAIVTQDTGDPQRTLPLTMTESFSKELLNKITPKEFVCLIRELIHNLERHESDEWLKLDGQIVFDPHAVERPLNKLPDDLPPPKPKRDIDGVMAYLNYGSGFYSNSYFHEWLDDVKEQLVNSEFYSGLLKPRDGP